MDGRLITQIVVSILLILNSISLFINIRRTEKLRKENNLLSIKSQFQDILIDQLMKNVDQDTRDRVTNNSRIIFNNSNNKFKIKSFEVVNFGKTEEENKENDSIGINE